LLLHWYFLPYRKSLVNHFLDNNTSAVDRSTMDITGEDVQVTNCPKIEDKHTAKAKLHPEDYTGLTFHEGFSVGRHHSGVPELLGVGDIMHLAYTA